MTPRHLTLLALLAACGDNLAATDDGTPPITFPGLDAQVQTVCDPATVLPTNFRLIGEVSAGAVAITTTGGISAGTVDATAGGIAAAADKPYIYLDLETGTKVELDDVAARTSTAWDIAFKRASVRLNGGDSGIGGRLATTVLADSLDAVTEIPTTEFIADDFTTADCALDTIPGGEPRSAFGEWYEYNPETHSVAPKPEVYVIARPDAVDPIRRIGEHGGGRLVTGRTTSDTRETPAAQVLSDASYIALRITTYNGDVDNPVRGAYYGVEWKTLP